jgi:hypothetical protein
MTRGPLVKASGSTRLKDSRYNDDDWTWRAQRDEICVGAQNRSAKASRYGCYERSLA